MQDTFKTLITDTVTNEIKVKILHTVAGERNIISGKKGEGTYLEKKGIIVYGTHLFIMASAVLLHTYTFLSSTHITYTIIHKFIHGFGFLVCILCKRISLFYLTKEDFVSPAL